MKFFFSFLLMFLFACSLNAQESKVIEKSDDKSGYKWREIFDGKNRGVQSIDGQTIIPCEFSYIYYSDGYFTVYRDNLVGLTDFTGKEIISPNRGYTGFHTYESKNGYIEVNKDKFAGLTDLTGKEIISPDRGYTYISTLDAKGGYIKVNKDKFAGLTDLTGKEIISPNRGYTYISMLDANNGYFVVEKNGKGVVNKQGTEIVAPVYGLDYCDATYYCTKDGVIVVEKKSGDSGKPFMGLFSTDGKELIPITKGYRYIDLKGEGIIEVKKNYDDLNGEKLLISDLKRGIHSSYDQVYYDSNLNCKVGQKGRYMCVLDKDNNELIPLSAHLTQIYSNKRNELMVKDENGYFGIVTSNLKWVIPLGRKYTTLLELGGTGKAPYYLVGSGDYRGVCDMAGRLIMDVAYYTAGIDDDGLAFGIKDGKTYFAYNYVDARGYYDKRKSDAAKAKMQRQQETKVSNSRFYIPIILNALANAASTQPYGSSSTGSSGFSGSISGRTPRQCGLCGGTGKTIENDVVTFGSNQKKWCNDCQRYVYLSHRHATCISCKGKGVW